MSLKVRFKDCFFYFKNFYIAFESLILFKLLSTLDLTRFLEDLVKQDLLKSPSSDLSNDYLGELIKSCC
jgi:hypothetical protein